MGNWLYERAPWTGSILTVTGKLGVCLLARRRSSSYKDTPEPCSGTHKPLTHGNFHASALYLLDVLLVNAQSFLQLHFVEVLAVAVRPLHVVQLVLRPVVRSG
jgi:hypothetical protein